MPALQLSLQRLPVKVLIQHVLQRGVAQPFVVLGQEQHTSFRDAPFVDRDRR
jgi:hypothetical protein